MPLLRKERFSDGTEIGIWEITENSHVLESMAVLSESERQMLAGFRNETRRTHWLSYRLVIAEILGPGKAVVKYMENGKPWVENLPGHISVTHSGCFSAAIYHPEKKVGIDIEMIKPRIENIASRFLSDKELAHLNEEYRTEHLVGLWAAKEALYKLWGKASVEYKDHLYVEPYIPGHDQMVNARITHGGEQRDYVLNISRVTDYVLVWVTEGQ
jgi:phosphopantetheinyl transferase